MTAQANKPATLEDLMVAMDVVDTLRHQQGLIDRELDTQGRRERLLERLRELYHAQGIDVTDQILEDGILALEEERFKYTPVVPNWQTKLASIWVTRARWGKPVGFLAFIACAFFAFYLFTDVLPERQKRAALPKQVIGSLSLIRDIAKKPEIINLAEQKARAAQHAIESGAYHQAEQASAELSSLAQRLKSNYRIRVVSKANQNSGIWRVPPNNPNARNYYLIVEAVDSNNKAIAVEVLNQENNVRKTQKIWGLRVDEKTFYKVAADRRDDGIIQANKVGQKLAGYLEPSYSIATTGATITDW